MHVYYKMIFWYFVLFLFFFVVLSVCFRYFVLFLFLFVVLLVLFCFWVYRFYQFLWCYTKKTTTGFTIYIYIPNLDPPNHDVDLENFSWHSWSNRICMGHTACFAIKKFPKSSKGMHCCTTICFLFCKNIPKKTIVVQQYISFRDYGNLYIQHFLKSGMHIILKPCIAIFEIKKYMQLTCVVTKESCRHIFFWNGRINLSYIILVAFLHKADHLPAIFNCRKNKHGRSLFCLFFFKCRKPLQNHLPAIFNCRKDN